MLSKAYLFIISLLVLSCVSASSEIIIYLDEAGNADFFGQSTVNLSLPSGISMNEKGRISGSTTALTSKSGEVWNFSFYLDNSEIEVYLPDNSILKNTNGEASIVDSYIQKGKIVVYSQDSVQISYTISKDSSKTPYIISLIIIFLVGFTGYIFYRNKSKRKVIPFPKKKNKIDKLSIVSSVLSERENQIISALKTSGKIKSSQLRKQLDMPKASFSRHIHELEKKSILRLSGEGKNKFVELTRN